MRIRRPPLFSLLASLVLVLCVLNASWSYARADFGADSGKAEVPVAMAQEYGAFADKAVAALVKGNGDAFRAMLSPGTIKMEQRGKGAIDMIIYERFIPFFEGFVKPHLVDQPFPTYRRIDAVKGVGFARSFYVSDGSERFYVIFIVHEDDKLTVGNLLLDKKLADVR
ncbi:MAG: hypothetical protein RIS36_1664 [Pseudomonadota bacterium]